MKREESSGRSVASPRERQRCSPAAPFSLAWAECADVANGREVNLLVEAAQRLGMDVSPQGCAEAFRPLLGGMGRDCSIAPTVTIISPDKLTLGSRVRIEGAVRIDASSERGIILDDDVTIQWGVVLSARGDQGHIHLGPGSALGAQSQVHGQAAVYVATHALIAPGVLITTQRDGSDDACTPIYLQEAKAGPIRIGDEASLGAGALVLGGVEIGAGAVIEPGAVVTADVPPFTVAAGVPARVVRSRGAMESKS